MGDYYIGLISGTSMDGIDAVLVQFDEASLRIIRTHEHRFPVSLRDELLAATHDSKIRDVQDVADLHHHTGECFRDAAAILLEDADIEAAKVAAIGSHGQTLRHEPDAEQPFSLQIGDPSIIADGTGITTVADFRTADIELGGQGAPLTPLFHEWLFREPGENRVVLNIGGIANVTILRGDGSDTTGFDTGPGNTLLDAWIRERLGDTFDRDGEWARQGAVDEPLLSRLLADPYFAAPPPKSTGFEYFNLDWLNAAGIDGLRGADVQATLCELTAASIAAAIEQHAPDTSRVLVCGGGVHNTEIVRRLTVRLPDARVSSTGQFGLDPDWVEAVAFAWLAMRTINQLPGNLPAVTGAAGPAILGTAVAPGRK